MSGIGPFDPGPSAAVWIAVHPPRKTGSRPLSDRKKFVAIGFLTAEDVKSWGADMKHVYPLPSDAVFDDLLRRLDLASAAPRVASKDGQS